MSAKFFLTGGTGLLGKCLAVELAALGEVVPARHIEGAPPGKDYPAVAIEDPSSVFAALDGKGYTHVVHSAAARSPEQCMADPAFAYLVNAVAVEHIAAACRRNGIKLIFISTDYVFPGSAPPYREECKPLPVNVYGRSKLAGEYAARGVQQHLIARIPALWSLDPGESRSPLKAFLDKLRAGKPFPCENRLVRHYSLADDIAKAVAFCAGKNMCGTIHLSAGESQTKADFARAIARHFGFDPGLVVNAPQPEGEDSRPQDSTLDTGLYRSHEGPHIRGVSEVFADCVKDRK